MKEHHKKAKEHMKKAEMHNAKAAMHHEKASKAMGKIGSNKEEEKMAKKAAKK